MCSLLQCVFKILYMHSQCGSVFIDAFLQYGHVATLDVGRDVFGEDWCNAACRFVCFMGRVLDALMGREDNDGGRRHISVMSSIWREKMSFEGPVRIVRGYRGSFSSLFVEEQLNATMKLDVQLTDDSSSDC